MSLYQYIKYRNFILKCASDKIDECENEILKSGYYTISCKNDILNRIKKEIEYYREDFSRVRSSYDDLVKVSMRMICTNSFELFEDDIYRVMGVVNWSGPARNAIQVHKMMIRYAVERGYVTQEEADEDAEALQIVINERL